MNDSNAQSPTTRFRRAMSKTGRTILILPLLVLATPKQIERLLCNGIPPTKRPRDDIDAPLPSCYQWKGDGPLPPHWYAPDGAKIYRSYEDYCDD